MPTRGRPDYVLGAVDSFMRQTWPWRELVIVDDADAPSCPFPLAMEGIRYHLLERRLTVGAKRNIAVSRAAGDIILHWDDDDWSAPARIEDQVLRLLRTGQPMTGYHSMVFFERQTRRAWRYSGQSDYAIGTSLCYRRDWWQQGPFPDVNESEDTTFWWRSRGNVACEDAEEYLAASIHPGNTSKRNLSCTTYQEIPWPKFLEEK